ncbi:MAG: dihydropteroate synthase [Culicoidibacterales bacterium]
MKIMGILNVTPDSFSDGGMYIEVERALQQAKRLLSLGATIIDVGGETTRPGATQVNEEEEIARVIPVIQAIATLGCDISIDTYKANVARAAIEAGATMINDVSGALYDPQMAYLAAEKKIPIILMHNQFAIGETPHAKKEVEPVDDIYIAVCERLQQSVDICLQAGVKRDQLILDPGIGFAKTANESWQLCQQVSLLHETFGLPILLGASRKRFLAMTVSESSQQQKDVATAIVSLVAWQSGCEYVRVHDVATTKTVLQTYWALQGLVDEMGENE